MANNYQAGGQVLPVTPVSGATTLALLGAASNGATAGTATITYTDGSTQTFTLGFSDWTLDSGNSSPAFGNQKVVTATYRNDASGKVGTYVYVFYADVALQSGKTVKSITLPSSVSSGHGQIHVFAVGTK